MDLYPIFMNFVGQQFARAKSKDPHQKYSPTEKYLYKITKKYVLFRYHVKNIDKQFGEEYFDQWVHFQEGRQQMEQYAALDLLKDYFYHEGVVENVYIKCDINRELLQYLKTLKDKLELEKKYSKAGAEKAGMLEYFQRKLLLQTLLDILASFHVSFNAKEITAIFGVVRMLY